MQLSLFSSLGKKKGVLIKNVSGLELGGVGSRENWLKSIFLFCLWRLNVVVRFELMLESRIGHLN